MTIDWTEILEKPYVQYINAVAWVDDRYEFLYNYLKKPRAKQEGIDRSLRTVKKQTSIPQEPAFKIKC